MADERNGAFDGMKIGKETDVLGENLTQCHFGRVSTVRSLPLTT
jgi:hypothetical protein